MKYFFIKKDDYDALPAQQKKLIEGISSSRNSGEFATPELSGVNYHIIKADLSDAIHTPLKNCHFHDEKETRDIIDSGIFSEAPNPKTTDEDGNPIIRSASVAVDDYLRVRHEGILTGTIAAQANNDFDWQVDQLAYFGVNKPSRMTGVEIHVDGGGYGMWMDFCVIDVDDILGYGPNTVLDQFGKKFYVAPDHSTQIKEHSADLIPGLYIRAHFDNPSLVAATFYINLFRYMDTR